jgi:NAD(P)-dependent dehydrogenase (short-subunit alcohol dehydrogenase family)
VTHKVALVTGGASGIGRATVETLLDRGWSVAVTDLNQQNGDQLLADFDAHRSANRLAFISGNVSLEADVMAAVELAVRQFGRLDGMVNNAGVGGAFGPVTQLDVEDWDATFAVLVRGVFLGIKHAARVMRQQGGGSIVNVASVAGIGGDIGPQAYSVAKAAVIHMGPVFATELGPDRIRVNAVCPGMIATPLNRAASSGRDQDLVGLQPWPDTGQPSHLADAIAFLLSEESAFITGQTIAVDGGVIGAGPRLGTYLGSDPRRVEVVGYNRGNTGGRTLVRGSVQAAAVAAGDAR